MSGQIAIRNFDENLQKDILSADVQRVWGAYKRLHDLQEMTPQQEKDILTILVANNLNPLKKEVFIVKYGKGKNATFTPLVAYQTLMKRAYEEGYDSKDISFKEKIIESVQVAEKDGVTQFKNKEDFEVVVTLTTSEGKSYSFSALWSQYAQYKDDGSWQNGVFVPNGKRMLTKMWKEKGVLMLRKCAIAGLFRTLPKANLQGMPYTREEMPEGEMKSVDPVVSTIAEPTIQERIDSFKSRVESLVKKGVLKPEQGDLWIGKFQECTTPECLKKRGIELGLLLEKKTVSDPTESHVVASKEDEYQGKLKEFISKVDNFIKIRTIPAEEGLGFIEDLKKTYTTVELILKWSEIEKFIGSLIKEESFKEASEAFDRPLGLMIEDPAKISGYGNENG